MIRVNTIYTMAMYYKERQLIFLVQDLIEFLKFCLDNKSLLSSCLSEKEDIAGQKMYWSAPFWVGEFWPAYAAYVKGGLSSFSFKEKLFFQLKFTLYNYLFIIKANWESLRGNYSIEKILENAAFKNSKL